MTDLDDATPPMARPRVAAGALFMDNAGRVMLVHPTYKEYWDIPGGYVEPGESPRAACIREVREELGIEPPIGDALVVDWAPADGEGDKILFIFDGGQLSEDSLSQLRFADGELSEARYIAPEDLEQFAPSRLVRRLNTALANRSGAKSIYAEHGSPVK